MKIIEFTHNYGQPALNTDRHSLIYTSKDFSELSDEGIMFDKGHFMCASKPHKLFYAFVLLRRSWLTLNVDTANSIDERDMRQFKTTHFFRWLDLNLPSLFPSWLFKTAKELNERDLLTYWDIDEKVMSFPCYRDTSRGLNLEFIWHWINEFVNQTYIVLGSDTPVPHSVRLFDTSYEKKEFIGVFNDLQTSNPYEIRCEADSASTFVIHFWYQNNIRKIKL